MNELIIITVKIIYVPSKKKDINERWTVTLKIVKPNVESSLFIPFFFFLVLVANFRTVWSLHWRVGQMDVVKFSQMELQLRAISVVVVGVLIRCWLNNNYISGLPTRLNPRAVGSGQQ